MSEIAAAGLTPALASAITAANALDHCTAAQARRALSCLDLTSLSDDDTDETIIALCSRAETPAGCVAAVCVYPRFVATAKRALGDLPVRVATVVNFPGGEDPEDEVVDLAQRAIADGADEIDVVMPCAAPGPAAENAARARVAAVRRAVGPGVPVKSILEISRLGDLALIARASALAIEGGTTFLKTSTGKAGHGATTEACAVMLDVIKRSGKPNLGLKPSGGIRTAAACARYLMLADRIMGDGWAEAERFRIGASGVVDDLVSTAMGGPAGEPGGADALRGEGY